MRAYGVADPNAGLAVGEIASDEWESLYDTLVAKGKVSLKAAGGVGVTIEKLDIADLDRALDANPAADITRVLESLRAGSSRHPAGWAVLARDPGVPDGGHERAHPRGVDAYRASTPSARHCCVG